MKAVRLLPFALAATCAVLWGATDPVKFAVAQDAQAKLAGARRVTIVFNGVDPLRTKAIEDALALELMRIDLQIVSRTRLETLIMEKLAEAPPQPAPKETPEPARPRTARAAGQSAAPAAPAPALAPQPAPYQAEPVGATQVAKAAAAQLVLVGTLVEERLRSAPLSTGKPVLEQPAMVAAATLQVVDVETDTVLMVLVGEWPNGAGISEAAADLAKALRQGRIPAQKEVPK
jgi:hypothetical protein